MKKHFQGLTILIVAIISVQTASAAWGDYDTTFGFLGGAVDTNAASHYPKGVALQADGKILVTGYKLVAGKKRFFLRRYLSNGQVDTAFGNNGSAVSYAFIIVSADYYGSTIVVQANGKIAVAGVGNGSPTIWRFTSSGFADTGFGNNGVTSPSGYETSYFTIATYANILYAGAVKDGYVATVILKLNSNGSPDTSFGTSGEAQTDANNSFSLAVDPTTGNLLVSGRRRSNPADYGVERFLTTGVLDSTFTHWGATYAGWIGSYPSQFLLLANGRFVLNERWANIASGGATVGASIVRLNSSGSVTSRISYEPTEFVIGAPAGDCPDLMAQQQDGRLVLKGENSDELFRFSTNFATVETMSCSNYGALSSPTPAVLQSDDKMIAAGSYSGYIALVRTIP